MDWLAGFPPAPQNEDSFGSIGSIGRLLAAENSRERFEWLPPLVEKSDNLDRFLQDILSPRSIAPLTTSTATYNCNDCLPRPISRTALVSMATYPHGSKSFVADILRG